MVAYSMSNPTKLRIAQVAPMVFPVPPETHGGTERVVADLTDALTAQGHDLTLFAGSDSQTSARLLSASASLKSLCPDAEAPGMLGVLESANLSQLRSRLADFDIIHCHTESAHAAVLGAARANSLTTIHWRTDQDDRQTMFRLFPDLPVAAISASQARHIPDKNLRGVVHHGIPETRFHCGPGGGPLAFIGRMTDQKRPDAAIRIAKQAGFALRLAGTVDVGNPLYFDQHVEPHLGGHADYIGPVDDSAKQDLLGHAKALLFPIDWPEPFGLVMIEAMACGTPVVAMNRGSVPEIVEDGVTGFIVDTEDEAAEAVRKAAGLDRQCIRARFEERFTATRMAADYEVLYRKLLA